MKKVLITGASGFVGGFLAEHLLESGGFEIYGTYTSEENLQKSPVKDKVTFKKVDFLEKEQVSLLLHEVQPEYIYHLVAQANVLASIKDPIATFHSNIDSEVNLFEALRAEKLLQTRVLVICSAEEYGYVRPDDLPVDEETPLRPANPYSVSKIAQDYLAFQYNLSYKLPLIRVRPYNHIGPRQRLGYVSSDFAKQIADIEKKKQAPVVKVGNLDAKRDFTDVRDMVRAYASLMEKGTPGDVYNIGAGVSHSAKEILDILIASSTEKIIIEVDQNRLRPSDIPEIVADTKKMQAITGWKPEITFDQTVKDILEYWRGEV